MKTLSAIGHFMFKNHQGRLNEITPTILFHWFLLSFMAGNLNAGGYLACSRFVSHVTGFATLAGIDFATGDFKAAMGMFSVPLFFLLGVMISAYCIDRRLNDGKKPRYAFVMNLVSVSLLLVAVAGRSRIFGSFDSVLYLKRDFLFMALLCMASGLTNAAITTSSGAFVRLTHLTGITTDLGIGIMRVLAMDAKNPHYKGERLANVYRAGTIIAFMMGSLVGALLFLRIQYLGFLLPAAVAYYAARLAKAAGKEEGPNLPRSPALPESV